MEAAISRVARGDLVERVAGALIDEIASGGLRPGAALPGEQALAIALGVSRPVLREAISRLRYLGLLDSRPRRGLRVERVRPFFAVPVAIRCCVSAEELREWLELRIVIEAGMAEPLFDRIRVEDYVQLEAIVQDEEADPFDALVQKRCDRAFHACCSRVVGNKQVDRLQVALSSLLDGKVYGVEEGTPPPGHLELLQTLRRGSPAKWRMLIEAHLRATYEPAVARLASA